MKKTKLFTSLAAFVLVLGLGACNQPKEEETTGDESGEVTTTDTDTGSGEEGGSTTDTDTTPKETNPDGYVLVGDFTDSNWDSKVSEDSKYYIPLGTTEYKQTVTIATEPDYGENDPWSAGLRVVEWGDSWNLVVGSDELDEASTGVIGSDGSKNIKVNWGQTYDITITFGETNSILVTVHEDGGNEGETTPTLFGFDVDGVINYIDGGLIGSYSYEGSITANIDEAIEVTATETEGDNAYYLTFELNNTTYYVCIIPVTNASGTFTDLQYETNPTAIYYDEDLDGWVNEDGTYFLCYNSAYKCLYASAIAEYGPSGSKGTSPIAHLYDYPTIEGITLSADSTEVAETQSLRIDVTYTPSTIGASNLEWESSDNEVATVEDGRVTGVAASETPATIRATTKNGLTATIDITVIAYEAPDNLVGTLDFSVWCTANASNTAFTTTTLGNCLSASYNGSGTITAVSTEKAYPASNGSGYGLKGSTECIQLGTSSATGSISFSLSNTDEITKAVINVVWYDSAKDLKVNDVSQTINNDCTAYSNWDDVPTVEYTITAASTITISSVTASNGRILVHSIELYSA